MGSVFTTIPGNSIKGFMNKDYDIPFFLQFVPGYTVEVVHSNESFRYEGDNTLGTIIAYPHISDQLYKRRASMGEEYRYFPLFRGMTEFPSKGDPVLLCTIGKVNYYLGPLNTPNNSPTWNDDPSYKPEQMIGTDIGNVSRRGQRGESYSFNKMFNFERLQKPRKSDLDYGDIIKETVGDMMFEGRHGNSIRIGSRSNDPYIFISNGRSSRNKLETLNDGGLISMISHGSISQHFGRYSEESNGQSYHSPSQMDFQLASDKVPIEKQGEFINERPMESVISTINQVDDVTSYLYDYGKEKVDGVSTNQILIHSNRVTLNAKSDDIYISSFKDIHIGTGRSMSISTNEDLIIESNSVYIGDPLKGGQSRVMDKMVLGEQLVTILTDLIGVLQKANGLVQGVPIPLVDAPGATYKPLAPQLVAVGDRLKNILSLHHYIEPNR